MEGEDGLRVPVALVRRGLRRRRPWSGLCSPSPHSLSLFDLRVGGALVVLDRRRCSAKARSGRGRRNRTRVSAALRRSGRGDVGRGHRTSDRRERSLLRRGEAGAVTAGLPRAISLLPRGGGGGGLRVKGRWRGSRKRRSRNGKRKTPFLGIGCAPHFFGSGAHPIFRDRVRTRSLGIGCCATLRTVKRLVERRRIPDQSPGRAEAPLPRGRSSRKTRRSAAGERSVADP
jgi:hypothetical protein